MNYDNIKIKVNGVILPPPVKLDYSLEDLDADSERDVNTGTLDRNRIRSDILKVSLSYSMNDVSTVSSVLKTISPATFTVEIFDIKNNSSTKKTMYAGPKSFQVLCIDGVWIKALKFNLMEV